MNECTKFGCRNLEWKCADCGRIASTATIAKIPGMGEWVSVEKELPPIGKAVLVIDRYGSSKTKGSIRQVTRNAKSTYLWKNNYNELYEFYPKPRYSHWMPLPTIPE